MAIVKYKPTTPGRRGMSHDTRDKVTKAKAEKYLTTSKKRGSGRNSQGRITVRHKGGGHKKRYRIVDFSRTRKLDIPGKVEAIEYDPNRNAYIMLVKYADSERKYHLAPTEVQVGHEIVTKVKAKAYPGNRMTLRHIPLGFPIYNLELRKGKGGQVIRGAGTEGKVISLEGKHAQVQMPSGEVRLVPKDCYASIGIVSNPEFSNMKIGKAGRNRWLGKRPQVRGSAMNPVDHPHGGGEGNQPIGLKHPKTPWGMPALGKRTRKNKATDRFIIKSRHRK
jgi:large subunit ribosomal protein L2